MKFNNPEDTMYLTYKWTGERFPDGRPKVNDSILYRLANLTTEQVWKSLIDKDYKNQFEGDLKMTHQGACLIGRAVTSVFVPSRPDVHMRLLEHGRKDEGRNGFFNQWLVESLLENDVAVVDMCDQILYGTYVGGNLSTAIKTRTKNGGAVIWGGIRDLEQIVEIEGYQVYYRGISPTPIGEVMMTGMNVPCRIGKAVCMPGDIVLGTISGVIFIPAHIADYVASFAEKTQLRDTFGFKRLASKTYTPAQIDQEIWSQEMMDDFIEWFRASDEAKKFQYLDWTEELEKSKNPQETKEFDGFVGYSYY